MSSPISRPDFLSKGFILAHDGALMKNVFLDFNPGGSAAQAAFFISNAKAETNPWIDMSTGMRFEIDPFIEGERLDALARRMSIASRLYTGPSSWARLLSTTAFIKELER